MEVDYTAKLGTYEDFLKVYQPNDEKKKYDGESLLFYSLSNNKPEDRYKISTFLLDKHVDVFGQEIEGNNTLHVLLSRIRHNLSETIELTKRLIDLGVDINQQNNVGKQVPFHFIIMMGFSDKELEPLYDLFFGKKTFDVLLKDAYGKTLIEYAETRPGRETLVKRMKAFAVEK